MAYEDLQIVALNDPVSDLETNPDLGPESLKAWFDKNSIQIMLAFNAALVVLGQDKDLFDAWKAQLEALNLDAGAAAALAAAFVQHADRHGATGEDAIDPDSIGAAKATGGYVDPEQACMPTKTITADYTLADEDNGYRILANSASAIVVTVNTQAAASYAANFFCALQRIGTGTVSVAAASGVNLRSAGNRLKIAEQNAAVAILKDADNVMSIVGNTAT